MEENIVKKTAKELGMSQKELAETMGTAEQTVRNWASKGEAPVWAIKFMEKLLENKSMQEEIESHKHTLEVFKDFKKALDNI